MRSPLVSSFQLPRALFSRFCGGLLWEREKYTTVNFNVFMHMEKESFRIFKLSSKKPHASCLHSPPCLTAHFQWNLLRKCNNKEAAKNNSHLLLLLFYFCLFILPGSNKDLFILLTHHIAISTRKENTILCQLWEGKRKGANVCWPSPKATVCLKGSATGHVFPLTRDTQILQDINIWQVQQSSFYIHWVWVAAVKIKSSDGLGTVNVQLPCHSVQVWQFQLHTAHR